MIKKSFKKIKEKEREEHNIMENIYSVIITKVPGGANPVISHGTETVAELFAAAFNGESINGYQITVGGVTREATYIPRNGENVTVAKMIKGN